MIFLFKMVFADLNDLRAKFEEDKKRVAAAKAARKFKPT